MLRPTGLGPVNAHSGSATGGPQPWGQAAAAQAGLHVAESLFSGSWLWRQQLSRPLSPVCWLNVLS